MAVAGYQRLENDVQLHVWEPAPRQAAPQEERAQELARRSICGNLKHVVLQALKDTAHWAKDVAEGL